MSHNKYAFFDEEPPTAVGLRPIYNKAKGIAKDVQTHSQDKRCSQRPKTKQRIMFE